MKKLLLLLTLLSTLTLNADSLRISAKTLNENINNYKILDTRDNATYKTGHINTALNFPISQTYAHMQENGKLTDPFTMQTIVQNLGLNASDSLVIYDDGSFFDAARLFWALEVYGFKNVKLLGAGYSQWIKQGYKTSTQIPDIIKSDYITIIDNNRLATKFSTQIATRNPNQIIIDARPNKAYEGEVSSAKRYGHIPKALSIPASHNIDNTLEIAQLRNSEQLAEI